MKKQQIEAKTYGSEEMYPEGTEEAKKVLDALNEYLAKQVKLVVEQVEREGER